MGLVNKSLGLLATIIGALYGGVLMQRLSLFRALMIFGLLQAVSNFAYWLLAVTPQHLWTMGSAVFIENLCGGMGTAAFVALLMTLCNKNFSATQFALLSALSAVGRVYVGPAAGWFVELWGWPLFYAFSVVAALPGLLLLWACRDTLTLSQKTGAFLPRVELTIAYRLSLKLLMLGALLLLIWLMLLIANMLHFSLADHLLSALFSSGLALVLASIIVGSVLDYVALRRTRYN